MKYCFFIYFYDGPAPLATFGSASPLRYGFARRTMVRPAHTRPAHTRYAGTLRALRIARPAWRLCFRFLLSFLDFPFVLWAYGYCERDSSGTTETASEAKP
jgi:hypothetical protein